jgi:hypothetical protein
MGYVSLRAVAISEAQFLVKRQERETMHPAVLSSASRPAARSAGPELKELVAEASRALARLDADRLEELALSCQALNRDLPPRDMRDREMLGMQARAAVNDMTVFARVLEATRANLQVMNRLRALRTGRIEYGDRGTAEGRRGID